MNISDIIQMIGQNIWIYGGSLILVLSILVFVHEWGHYIIARMCGVRVEKFSIGFGKEIWGFNDKAGTRWKISLIPLGGYVQLFGDTDPASAGHTDCVEGDEGEFREMTEAEKKVAFYTKPIWKRTAIVFAGPAINYIFAIILLSGLYIFHGQPVSLPKVAAVVGESSADQYGFLPHDQIVSIDGKKIEKFSDIRREMMVALDLERHFIILRDGELVDIHARPKRVPVQDRFGFKSTIGILGVFPPEKILIIDRVKTIDGVEYENSADVLQEIKKRMGTTFRVGMGIGETVENLLIHPVLDQNPDLANMDSLNNLDGVTIYLSNTPPKELSRHTMMTAMQSAIKESYVMTRTSLEALWQMVVGVRSATELGGIIRIGAIAGDMAQQGIVPLVLLTALLSINLGFINLLPIPMLDGGHLMFYFFEAILGRPVPEKIMEYSFRAGFFFLIGIMAFANLNDLYQLFM